MVAGECYLFKAKSASEAVVRRHFGADRAIEAKHPRGQGMARRGGRARRASFIVIVAGLSSAAMADGPPQLALPLACEPQKTCFIQSYVDLDASSKARDYACGSATYEGHSGVDFRVLSAHESASLPVLAAADGTVKGVRDGVADALDTATKPPTIAGQECGNGVVLDHGDGWETQYCHLRNASVAVRDGDRVTRGSKLGNVGTSGITEYAHLYVSVRHDGQVIDPFLPDVPPGGCQRGAPGMGVAVRTLWQPSVAAAFPYRNGQIIGAGLVSVAPDHRELERDHTRVEPVAVSSPAIVIYGRLINLLQGDRIRLVITGPFGALVETLTEPLHRDTARYTSFAGKKRKSSPWPQGRYEGRVQLVRDGAVVATNVVIQDLR